MKTKAFEAVPKEIWSLIKQACNQALKQKRALKEERRLRLVLVNLDYPELKPTHGVSISFSTDSVAYSIIYMKDKLEVSNYISEDSGSGTDHYQSFNFTYTRDFKEEDGDLDTLLYDVKRALEEAEEITVSNEE
uniref:hypothetical protein n=1 Tax=Roseivirga sp. TaxID=1964215 RepID=UPI004047545A